MADNKKISKIKIGTTTYDIKDPNQPAAIEFDSNYDASTNKAATVQTVVNKINALDGGTIGTPGAGKTVTALSQTNGNVSATFGNISITKSQVSDFPNSMPASDVYSWAKASSKPSYTYSEVGAAASDHTHDITLATDTGTSTVTLASAGKYKLTAGGKSIIFTMPTIPTVNYPVTSVNSKTGAVSLTYSDVSAASSTHTHDISLATSSGTSTVTLASAGKYALTAGGKSVIFTMPTIPTVSYPVTSVNTKTGAVVLSASDVGAIASSLKGANNGVAELDSSGKIPSSQLPSFVDDVLEYTAKSDFPATGETGKIYVDKTTNLTWRWSGSAYVEISPSLALGETSSTAYRGDRGKTAYDHSQSTHARTDATAVTSSSTNGNIKINGTETTVYTHPGSGTNPHGTTASDVGLGNVGNFKAVSTVASQGLSSTEQSNARANIGAGTSNLTIGTTSSTAAAGNHTHTTTLASDTGTSTITLASAGKYKLTAGGTSVIFTMPTIPSVSYPVTSVAGKTGDVTLTNSDVGLGNVGNFKAVSTVASQGLTSTEQSNARANIGAGTSNLTIGTTSSTAAAGNHSHAFSEITSKPTTLSGYGITDAASSGHTHTLTIASDTGTSSLDMAANTKYKITAGGNSFVFKTPADSAPVTSVNNKTGAVSLTYSDVGAQVAGNYASSSHTHDLSIASSSGTSALTMAANTKYQLTAGGKTFIFTTPPDSAPVTSVAGKTGAVTLTNSDVGLGNVGNFKAVSTVASQSLTSTEQANARANIGAGTSSLTIGSTATTAAAGNHTHTLSLATSTGNPSINLAANTKYQLSAGGSTYIFTTPPDTNDNYYHTTGSWSGLTYTATANGGAGALAFTIPTGTTSTTVAKGDHTHTFPVTSVNSKTGDVSLSASDVGAATSGHTHTTSLATDTGTSSITLASAGKYKLTAGGTSVIFTMPTSNNYTHPSYDAASAAAKKIGRDSTGHVVIGDAITASDVGAATSGHTHTASIATDTGTSAITLASAGKYKLTAGGSSVVFTMPTIPTVSYPVTSVNSKTGAVVLSASDVSAIATSAKGAANGVAELGSDGKVPSSQLPSYVDDVLEYASQSSFPATGETGKIYIAQDTNKTYRWSGTAYVEISPSLALGETSSTAYRGDRGKTAYDHSQLTSGNPHGVTKTDVGLGNVGNFKAVSTVASQGLTTTEQSNARANIGAGTSSLTIGTTSTTAAAGNHTHTTTLATDTGTSSITLASAGKYKLTAGGTSVVFTMPTIPSVSYPVTSVNSKTGDVTLTAADVGASATDEKLAVSALTERGSTLYYPLMGATIAGVSINTANTRVYDYGLRYTVTSEGSNGTLTVGNNTIFGYPSTGNIYLVGAAGGHTIKSGADNSGVFTATLPKKSGTVALTSDIPDVSGKIDTAGTGLSKSGTTLNHSNSVTAQTTQALYPIKIDAQGHISAYGSAVTSLPASDVYSWAKASSKPSYTASEVGAATSDHTHTLSLATTSDTSSILLTANTKYKLTAGGSTYVFTTPAHQNLSGYVPTSRTINSKALSANISLSASDVGAATSDHTHGNIQNGGTLQTNDITIASGDKLVVTDSSDSSKIARTSISFDGSTTTKALTQKGTWETFGTSNLAIGTTGTTAAAGNHTHTTTLATDTGTSTVTLASAGKYKLTAGGSSVIFTMPTIPTVNYPVTSVNSQTGAVSLSASDVGAATSGHTHTLSMATSSGTSSISLSANTKYQLTAGGSTYIFTTPVDNNTWNANSATVAGYVASPASTPGVTWKTNSSGTPNWQNEYYFQLSTTDALYTAITNAGWVNDVIV